MAFLRNPVVYVPDLTNGRPIVDGKVYVLVAGTVPPTHDSAINPATLVQVTYENEAGNIVNAPQPLYTSKGGCLYGEFPEEARQYMVAPQAFVFVVYDKIGRLQYSSETNASDYVETSDLAESDSTVLVGGVEAGDVAKRVGGFVTLEEFEGTPAQKLQAAYDSGASHIKATLSSYNFGAISGDTALFTFTRFVDIDFNNALITVQSQNTGVFTATAFIKLLDTGASIRNLTFDDQSFTFTGPSRGAQTIQIANSSANTSGYHFENFRVIRAQSIITAISTNPNLYRARDIFLVGRMVGESTYYGINLANNGDNVVGSYKVGDFNRALFAYGTDGLDVQYVAETGQPTSAAMLISSSGSSFPETKNYKIRAEYKLLNGNVCIKGQTAADTGVYKNIQIDLTVLALNSNKTTSYFFSIGDDTAASGTYAIDGLSLKLYSPVVFSEAVRVATETPNISGVTISSNATRMVGGYENALKNVSFTDAVTQGYFSGNLTTGAVFIASKQLNQGRSASALFACELNVVGYNDTSFSGQRLFYARYFVSGYISSGGVVTITNSTELDRVNVGASPYPVVTIAAAGSGGINVSADTYANTSSRLCVTCTALRV